ncbi:MAG: NapC/NirT family cytochrome c [Candidatus Adiutrix sp.]|jgi:nitrate/TMAO reductase-like tetraheme cytochrome c subunit|nr:NapC/NirT family cytochrome c [Candidatus Adiutrix sp.]
MNEKKQQRLGFTIFLAVCGLILFCGATGYALHATSSTAFCMSCHEMEPYLAELNLSSHAKDRQGGPVECAQCHIPQGFGPRYFAVKTYSGVKDLAVHFWSKPSRLNRVHTQKTARRFVDDANCLACHQDLYKNAKEDAPVSDYGRLAHDAYLGKNGTTKNNCAGCHINLAHLPEFDRWLETNAAFASRLKREEVKD